jgi:hypothetical protein
VGDQRLGAVGVAPRDVLHGAVGGRVDAVRAGLDELGEVAGRVVLDRVVDLAGPRAALLHGDQPGAGAAAAVVRAHVLVEREAPLDQRAAPVPGVADDVGEVLVVLVGDPGAARVLGAELAHRRMLVVHLDADARVAEVPVPGDAAEERVVAQRRVGEDRPADLPVVAVVPVVHMHLGGDAGGPERGGDLG